MPLLGSRYDPVTDSAAVESKKRGVRRDEDFEFGIKFTAKYIGTQDVAQPHNRVEIVAAMRRIRFECKARGIKKQKIDLTISVKGVTVVLFRRNKKRYLIEGNVPILDHPIYRIFYVSHDSHDLLIFSYISREPSTNNFRCNVFKAFKKSHAVQIVCTIGQAFDICHKMALEAERDKEEENGTNSNTSDPTAAQNPSQDQKEIPVVTTASETLPEPILTSLDSGRFTETEDALRRAQRVLAAANFKPSAMTEMAVQAVGTISSPLAPLPLTDDVATVDGMMTSHHQMQLLLHQQRELHSQQMHYLLSQMQLVKDQLTAETDARIEAQARTHQLLGQNQELLEHINLLVKHLTKLESSQNSRIPSELQYPSQPPAVMETAATSTLFSVRTNHTSLPRTTQSFPRQISMPMKNVSPDSGHREMSSESLTTGENSTHPQVLWYTLPTKQTTNTEISSAVDFKQSFLTLSSAKSVESSRAVNGFYPACNTSVLEERLKSEDVGIRLTSDRAEHVTSSPTVLPFQSSCISMQTECRYNHHLKSELLLDSNPCRPNTDYTQATPNNPNSTFVKNPTIVCDSVISANAENEKRLEIDRLFGSMGKSVVTADVGSVNQGPANVASSVSVVNGSVSSHPFNGGWNRMSSVSLNSQNSIRQSHSNYPTVNSLPVNFTGQLLHLN